MNVIKIGNYWTNINTTVDGVGTHVGLYFETDDTDEKHLARIMPKETDYNDYCNNHPILIKALNAALHMQTRTEFMKTRMTDDIELLTLFPWENKVVRFKYDTKMRDMTLVENSVNNVKG